ncbi:PREDICTED: protein IQ-DOMAIN 32-like isoform X2 [Tarenaya hassleriana]|uniref:protein IQ-DOMAIN 32-like isoform X2 n=1 Tax=Tarenaya hassleriana TaxID=28532 RepID=UPI00053C330C|nr:PREDICTED: protein IQ-DOMAIN 32-like isoform X2 [Tarenaya hassleriana]
MGKSPAYCFRIITCGGGDGGADDPTAKEAGDLNSYENKSSSGNRGWSFRKKSGRHRGLNSTTVSEPPAVTRTRETLESALLKPSSPDNGNVSEKPFTDQCTDDKSQLPVKYLAEEPTEEKPRVIVPQAEQPMGDKTEFSAPRVKELVDDRTELPVPVESRETEVEDDGNEIEKETQSQVNSKGSDVGDATVIEKDSGSEVHIASNLDVQEPETDDVIMIRKENDEEVDDDKIDESAIIIIQTAIRGFLARRKLFKHKKAVKLQAAVRGHLVRRQAMGSLRCVQAIVKMQALVRARQSIQHRIHASEISDKTDEMNRTKKLLQNKFARHLMESAPKTRPVNLKCDPTQPSSAWNWLERWMFVSSPDKTSKPSLSAEEQQSVAQPEEVPQSHNHLETIHLELETETEKNLPSDEASEIEVGHVEISEAEEPESAKEWPENSLMRKPSNPSFIAVQSKFEELSSSSTGSERPMALSYKTETSSSVADNMETRKELSIAEQDVTRARLDCTDLSVPLTLETAEKNSETGPADSGNEAKFPEKGTFETDTGEVTSIEIKDLEEKLDQVEESVVSETQQKPIISTPDAKKHQEPLSPESASPMTIPESQATPASQASSSVKAEKDKTRKSGSGQKRKVSKKMMTSSPNHESGDAGSAEQETGKDQRSGKRRNSFGFDQEPRDSGSGKSSLPRFMQPTESARAKVQEHNSPRSSPDVHEKDGSIKKRHSLPGPNGKQSSSSPRIQRSASQTTKERKWQR